jgi:lipopolysaccharide/colanic/teichoic acid biosynthesis glycosyltransferase
LDILGSTAALVVLAPVFAVIAIAIKASYSGVPVFFGVKAVGRGKRSFRFWKFSTMRADAHLVLQAVLDSDPCLKTEWRDTTKLRDDPRVLPGLGQFMRRTSLNELPQFYNVLIGEMSLVGPRPITEEEVVRYLEYGGERLVEARLATRPGITGLWQVSGRNDITYRERVQLDAQYLDTRSTLGDLKILALTVWRVLQRRGAY